MPNLELLFRNNRQWSEKIRRDDPSFFEKLAQQQAPEYLWIGCSDSRVPANEICGLLPGEIFVHRNVANIVVHSDLNCLAVMQYAVDVLLVKHILIVGHYGCGGVRAADGTQKNGLIDNWLRHVQDVKHEFREHLAGYASDEARVNRLCELNVVNQVFNTAQTTVIRNAWDRGQRVAIHGWIYDLRDGLVRSLGINLRSAADLEAALRQPWEEMKAELPEVT